MYTWRLTLLTAILLWSQPVSAAETFRYPEASHGKGRLQYVGNVPVLTVEGTPEEIGEQLGVLALKPAAELTKFADEYLARWGWDGIYKIVLKTGNILLPRFPAHHAKELEAAAAHSGWPRELLVFGNTAVDLRHLIQCSALIIESDRSATGEVLFGRNLDWPPAGRFHEYTYVVVYRPTGKRAFASVALPGVLGCTSAINDAGLAIAMLDVTSSEDGAPSFNPLGAPTHLMLRRIMEECATIDDAERLLRSVQRASMLNIAICDRRRGAVLEVTPKSVVLRGSQEGICICTNHFRSAELAGSTACARYEKLADTSRARGYEIRDVAQRLHSVNQGAATIQSMVFEPSTLRLHLAFGEGPASQYPLQTLELAPLLRKAQ